MHFELDVQDDSPYPTQTTIDDGIAFVDDILMPYVIMEDPFGITGLHTYYFRIIYEF
jgi:hypothetical protein